MMMVDMSMAMSWWAMSVAVARLDVVVKGSQLLMTRLRTGIGFMNSIMYNIMAYTRYGSQVSKGHLSSVRVGLGDP